MFTDHTVDTAPPAARRILTATTNQLGYLPVAVARLAEAPEVLDGFLKLSAMFEKTTLDPLAREVVIMTIATTNECHVCVAMHTAKLTKLGADPEVITALREQRQLPDARLDAVRTFTLEVLANKGNDLEAFLEHGFTNQNALEVVLGIGTYTLSTLANRLTDAPLDEQLEPFRWTVTAPAT